MLRIIAFSILLTTVLAIAAQSETPKFTTDAATNAVAEYLRRVEDARRECLMKLESAQKDALASGQRDDVQKIQAAKAAIDGHRAADVFDPFAMLEKRVTGTRWANRDNPRLWSAFDKDHMLRNAKGEAGKWAVVDDNTIASTTGVKYVYLWVFEEDGQNMTLQRFRHDEGHARTYRKQ